MAKPRIFEKKQGRLQVFEAGTRNRYPVAEATTSGSAPSFGLVHFGSTSGAKEFAIDAPEPGARLYLSCTAASTSNTATVAFSTDNSVTLDGSTKAKRLQFVRGGAGASLIGRSTSKWSLLDSVTGSTEVSVSS